MSKPDLPAPSIGGVTVGVDLVQSDALTSGLTAADADQGGRDVWASDSPRSNVSGLEWIKTGEDCEQKRKHPWRLPSTGPAG